VKSAKPSSPQKPVILEELNLLDPSSNSRSFSEVCQLRRRGRQIAQPTGDAAARRIRVAILLYDVADRRLDHLPDWEESVDGFYGRLQALFRVSPPTAVIVEEVVLFTAAQQFLAQRGLRVPEDVSLVCIDADPTFAWCQPPISHIRWDSGPVVRRILNWAANVSCGKKDLRQTLTPAEFVHGGTIGLVKLTKP
jgi:DNA-binding LacI/PurR family transcriptional regulator